MKNDAPFKFYFLLAFKSENFVLILIYMLEDLSEFLYYDKTIGYLCLSQKQGEALLCRNALASESTQKSV